MAYLILKQFGVHDSGTTFRELTDVATKEHRLTGFQRLAWRKMINFLAVEIYAIAA